MSSLELFIIAVGLSMDAFAVSVCKGLSLRAANIKSCVKVGLYFGIFQAAMPLLGYYVGSYFADYITAIDHWIAFVLLLLIGGKMVKEGLDKNSEDSCEICQTPERVAIEGVAGPCGIDGAAAVLSVSEMVPMAIATSIDALAVGVTFAFLSVNIVPAVSFIGLITFSLSTVGVKIGNAFGSRLKSKAELVGGFILIFMGIKILLEHTGII